MEIHQFTYIWTLLERFGVSYCKDGIFSPDSEDEVKEKQVSPFPPNNKTLFRIFSHPLQLLAMGLTSSPVILSKVPSIYSLLCPSHHSQE